ncbi:bifunctional DNA primase/polymerase [Alienimonas sp. DA493]|uniref:bifunctional DNA primase/polymerase n=1 Tax=Alienimonas sp. DA493 TaxID=3373605 RepID=UPI00375519E5
MLPDNLAGRDPAAADGVFDDSRTAERFYANLGWVTLPTEPGEKRPFFPYADRRDAGAVTTSQEAQRWWGISPEYGIAIGLGGVGPTVVDVDSAAAAAALADRLGGAPVTWTADSGSADPDRFHLYFETPPGLPAAAKLTPWHAELEFRGAGGLIQGVPSTHASGRRYRWREGLSPLDLPLAPLPGAIVAEFHAQAERKAAGGRRVAGVRPAAAAPPTAMTAAHRLKVEHLPGVCRTTKRFLLGEFGEGPDWNGRLFRAACDLNGNGHEDAWAEAALLLGAAPWDAAEEEKALATIESAFSRPRSPAVERPDFAKQLRRRAR